MAGGRTVSVEIRMVQTPGEMDLQKNLHMHALGGFQLSIVMPSMC